MGKLVPYDDRPFLNVHSSFNDILRNPLKKGAIFHGDSHRCADWDQLKRVQKEADERYQRTVEGVLTRSQLRSRSPVSAAQQSPNRAREVMIQLMRDGRGKG